MSTATSDNTAADKCPVDHTARQKWLEATKNTQQPPPLDPSVPIPRTRAEAIRILHERGLTKYSLDRGRWEADFTKSKLFNPRNNAAVPKSPSKPRQTALPTERQISSIPRATPATNHDRQELNSAELAALPPRQPANNEAESGQDDASGNWIYPSQSMFFAAMKRKGHTPNAADMATIVPIHNAVNERAWSEIKGWEAAASPPSASQLASGCDGPKLVSFSGDSSKLTPRARWRGWVGYEGPFDRHDWVIERCGGERVEYVIDFYGGLGGSKEGGSLSFHLDVRPKLNSFEGWRMRVARGVGWE